MLRKPEIRFFLRKPCRGSCFLGTKETKKASIIDCCTAIAERVNQEIKNVFFINLNWYLNANTVKETKKVKIRKFDCLLVCLFFF